MADLTGWDMQRVQKALGITAGDRFITLFNLLDTLSSTELGAIDGVTAGTATASKAVILDSSGEVDTIGFSGPPTTSSGVGAKNGATVTAVEYGDGVMHKTVLTCTATPVAFTDQADTVQYGGVKVYDFPAGALTIMGAVIDGDLTAAAPFIDEFAGDVALGTATATTGATLTGTEADILPSTAISAGESDKIAPCAAVPGPTALTESGARWLNGTETAIDMFLNFVIDDNAAHTGTLTGTFTGTITFIWMNLGTIA